MNREMGFFFTLAVTLGTLLFLGLQFEPRLAPLQQPRSLKDSPHDVAEPSSSSNIGLAKERKNPFAPPVEVKPVAGPKHNNPLTNAPPPPPPPPAPTPVPPKPRQINELKPGEIPVGFQGIFALPDQPPEAHLLAKDGSTMVVHIGDVIKALDVKIVNITGNDVTVQVGDHWTSLRELLDKQATDNPDGGATPGATPATPTGPTGDATKPTAADLVKKILASGGGKLDMSLLKDLPPDVLQQVLSDPQIQKLVEDQIHPQSTPATPGDGTPKDHPARTNGGFKNRGGGGGGGANTPRGNKTEVQR